MIVSAARIEANRKNALKSTGPRTEEGKDRSRQNALKHGLTASVVVPEDPEAVQKEVEALYWSLRPRDAFQRQMIDDIAIAQIRARRCQRIERRARDKAALRAMTSWDDDRRLDAERLAAGLSARPGAVVAGLRRTPHGCDWLIAQWAMLAAIAIDDRCWPEDCRRLAFDLLGVRPELRVGHPGAVIDEEGRTLDAGTDPLAVARSQVAALREAREAAAGHDEVERSLAESDLSDEVDPEIRRLRRYESSLHGRVRWSLARFRDPMPEHYPTPSLKPQFVIREVDEAREQAEAQAELDAKAERDNAFEAEYYAKARAREAERLKREEAKAKRKARDEARRRRLAEAKERDEANPEMRNEAISEMRNEATPEMQNEAICDPDPDSPADFPPVEDRREARLRQAGARREARKRKLDRRRA